MFTAVISVLVSPPDAIAAAIRDLTEYSSAMSVTNFAIRNSSANGFDVQLNVDANSYVEAEQKVKDFFKGFFATRTQSSFKFGSDLLMPA